jgi:hypothetical protein
MQTTLILFGVALLGYGLFNLAWPEKVREHYLSNFNLDSPYTWYNPATWLRRRPGRFVFRIFGVFFVALGVFPIISSFRT